MARALPQDFLNINLEQIPTNNSRTMLDDARETWLKITKIYK